MARLARHLPRAACAVFCAALLVLPSAVSALGNGHLQILHVDVGQGDGALLISPLGQTALFDDGTYLNCSTIISTLQSLGITTVDYHFASHYHADHIGCIDDLAAVGITIGTAGYDRGYSYTTLSYTSYVNTLGAKRRTIAKGQTITLDAGSANPVTITCVDLNGAGYYSIDGSDENPKSVVYRIGYGAFREEIGGDLTGSTSYPIDVETPVGWEVGHVDVYKVHHHGSRYSTNDNWLAETTPRVAVVSIGDGNSYGHPTADAMNRLHAHGVKVYWTETGTGAIPDPLWDTVAHGTVTIDCCGHGSAADTFTVSGPAFRDAYAIASGLVDVPLPVAAGGVRFDVDRTVLRSQDAHFSVSGTLKGPVEIAIRDVRGRVVRRLTAESPKQDAHAVQLTWDGRDDRGTRVAAAVYIAALHAGGRPAQARRVIVLR
jgi:beta-lactamase superfamily II metal-dependent hydrolase